MTTILLVLLVLAPAVPGVFSVGRAFSHKDRRAAKRAIRWAGVTALTALAIVAVTYIHAIAAAPSDGTRQLLAEGLVTTTPAVRLGAAFAATLGFLGGLARGLAPEDEPRRLGG